MQSTNARDLEWGITSENQHSGEGALFSRQYERIQELFLPFRKEGWVYEVTDRVAGAEERLDLRLEGRHTGPRHGQFTSGMTEDRRTIGDAMGPNSEGLTLSGTWNGRHARLARPPECRARGLRAHPAFRLDRAHPARRGARGLAAGAPSVGHALKSARLPFTAAPFATRRRAAPCPP